MILLKSKILSHFERVEEFLAANKYKIALAFILVALAFVLISTLMSPLSAYAASVSDEIQPRDYIPLVKGYIELPAVSYGFMLQVDPSVSYSEFLYEVLNEAMVASDSPFRYRFHGSDTINYISSFSIETISNDSFRILASDGFVVNATFATCTILGNLLQIQFAPVDYVCVADVMSDGVLLDYYILNIQGLAYPIEAFIDYGSGGGGTVPECPTLPELLADYTGSFESIVDMLNTKNYDEYDAWVNEVAQDARDAGKQEGLQEGFLIGKDAGYLEGEVDGFQDGYNKGTSDQLVKGFFGNLFSGIIEAFEKVEFYNDGSLVINFWTIFCSVAILSIIIILLKVWRGG